jgi:hypothetical protein
MMKPGNAGGKSSALEGIFVGNKREEVVVLLCGDGRWHWIVEGIL